MKNKYKIGKDVILKDSEIGDYVEINDNCNITESKIGNYTYCNGYNQIMYAEIGKFSSIAC